MVKFSCILIGFLSLFLITAGCISKKGRSGHECEISGVSIVMKNNESMNLDPFNIPENFSVSKVNITFSMLNDQIKKAMSR